MNVPLRLYGLIGCPHCIEGENFLVASKVPYQAIAADGDPVAIMGVKQLLGKEEAQFPILISNATKEVVVGFKREDYERLVGIYSTMHGNGAPDAVATKSDNPEPPSQVVSESTPAPEGVV